MKVNLNYEPALDFFRQDIKDIAESMFNQRGKIVKDCAKVVSAAVVKNLSLSDVDTPLYKHMKTDVKTRIKDNDMGDIVAIIGGGKETAYKWHLVDNGTSETQAQHFTDKSLNESESGVDAIMDRAIFKAVDSGR